MGLLKPTNRTIFKKYFHYCVYIFPLVFLCSGLNFNYPKFANDPHYVYLVNSAVLSEGKAVGYIDHPGTTVMQIGAATIAGIHLFSGSGNESKINHVIRDPEKFMGGIRMVIVILNSLILLLLGWVALKKTGSVWLSLLLQVSTLISANSLDHIWTKLSPEPLLFFVTGIFVLTIVLYYFEKDKNQWKYVLFFSLVTGAGLGTKVTFLPLIVIPLIILPTFKKKLGYLLGIVPAFVLFTIPAIPEYKGMYFWMRNLFQHTGIYGSGEKGIIDVQTYFPNIIRIFEINPVILFIVVTGILVLLTHYLLNRNKETNWDARFLCGIIGTFILGTLLVAKHHKEHYIIPILLLNGIGLYFILNIINTIFQSKILNTILLPIVVTIYIFIVGMNQPNKMKAINQDYKAANFEIDAANFLIEHYYPDFTRINYYTFSLNKFTALKFGNDFSKQKILSQLTDMYPHTYFYEFSSDQFINWNQKVQLSEITERHGNKILLLNGPSDDETVKEIRDRGFPLIRIYDGIVQNLYILDSLDYVSNIKDEKYVLKNNVVLN